MTSKPSDAPTRTVDRALTLLRWVCEKGETTLGEAARGADLSPSTALRLLRTLEGTGLIRKDDDVYSPGNAIIQLGAMALSHNALIVHCQDAMRNLVSLHGESVYLAVEGVDNTVLYIAMKEGTHSVRHVSWVGRSLRADRSASGAALRGEVREEGFVDFDNLVEQDIMAISAPIQVEGRIVAALSIVLPTYRADPERVDRIGRSIVEEIRTIHPPTDSAPPVSKENL